MDEMSDADRNSEADEDGQEEEEREGEGEMEVGKDKGGEGGLVGDSKVGMGPGREGEVVVAEDVPRWGVVLVQADRLDGESFARELDLGPSRDRFGTELKMCLGAEKRNLFEEGVTVTIYSLSPSAVNVRPLSLPYSPSRSNLQVVSIP